MPRKINSHSIFWYFWTIKIWSEEKINDLLCQSTSIHQVQAAGRDQDARYQASSYRELGVSITWWNVLTSFNWKIGSSVLQCKEQNRQNFRRGCFYNSKIFDWDPDRRNAACIPKWQMRMSLNIEKKFNNKFFGNFRLSGCWCNEQKQRFFYQKTPPQLLCFRLSSWRRNSNS